MNLHALLDSSGDPETAHRQWKALEPLFREESQLFRHPGFPHFLKLLGNSHFLVEYLLKEPHTLKTLIRSPCLLKAKPVATMRREIKIHDGPVRSIQKTLRDYKFRELCRIAIRDLAGFAPFEEIGLELSRLAQVEIEAALASTSTRRSSFTIIALGKLGGEDLNFSSDIDLLYLYEEISHASAAKISEVVTRLLNERTEDGIAFRVDLNLRPEGKNGPLVNSLEAIETYYEVQGASWERGALLKARPVAGNAKLGEKFLRTIEPFVYRKAIDYGVIAEIKKLKEKINEELKQSGMERFNVKLGPGGIREIEFFTNAFQLIYGGKEPRLRERNTLKVLDQIEALKLAPHADLKKLKSAYQFLRRIENRLQMVDERQVHTLPHDRKELLALARRLGFQEIAAFQEEFRKTTRDVNDCFERLAP